VNHRDYVKERLICFKREDIIFTDHAEIRIIQRQLSKTEIIENILNPVRLEYARREEASRPGEEKYACYFGYSKTQCQEYILIIKRNIVVVSVVKINRRWQRIAERKARRKC
jgi:hypothetical protein